MASNRKESNARSRSHYTELVKDFLISLGEDANFTKSNEVNWPFLNDEGSEEWATLIIRIPNGTREGEPYDGYAERQAYSMACENAEKRKKEKEEKLRKLAEKNKTKEKENSEAE